MKYVLAGLIGAILGLIAAGVALSGYDVTPKQTEKYSLVITLSNGNEYAIDHNLTKEDCSKALINTFGLEAIKGVECKRD